MNDIFDFRRFIVLLRRFFVENGMKLLGSIVFVLVLCVFWMLLFSELDPRGYKGNRDILFCMGLVFGPVLYVWIIANEFSTTTKGTSYLLLPFSIFEKWLVNVVVSYVFFVLFFVIAFKIVDYWILIFLKNTLTSHPDAEVLMSRFIALDLNMLFLLPVFLGWIISLSILIGVLQFRKNALLYSLTIFFACFLGYLALHFGIAQIIFEGKVLFEPNSMIPYSSIVVKAENAIKDTYKVPSLFGVQNAICLTFLPLLILLSWSYYAKLKEKQV